MKITIFNPSARSIFAKTLPFLTQHGYCVIDDLFTPAFVGMLRHEMKMLQEFGVPYPCGTFLQGGLLSGYKKDVILKQNVQEVMFHEFPELSMCFGCFTLLDMVDIRSWLNEGLEGAKLKTQTLKAIYASHGGCFPMHVDAIDDRMITAILYVNETWKENDGGQLWIQPWFQSKPVEIAPENNRLVLFSSKYTLHRTLPSPSSRYSLNVWFSGEWDIPEEMEKVLEEQTQFARLDHASSWSQSLDESHSEDGARLLKEIHWRDVDALERATPLRQYPAFKNTN